VDLGGHSARQPQRRAVGEVERRPKERAVAAGGEQRPLALDERGQLDR